MAKWLIRLILIITMIVSYAFISIAQSSSEIKKITINSKNKSLRNVLEEISRETSIEFIYDDKLVDRKTVSCDVKNKIVEEVLDQILAETGIAYRIVQNQRFVLYRSPPLNVISRISGRVIDASTDKPLHFVNLFLSGTTLGSATDMDGRYIIYNIPSGNYELNATMMGYENQHVNLNLFNVNEKIVDFKLKPKAIKGETVSITGEIPREWKKNLKIFESLLFGSKEFAKKCKLRNPEVLDFKYDKDAGQFRAFIERPLTFTNRALGYEVTLLLDDFYAELTDDNIYGLVESEVNVQRYQRHKLGRFQFMGRGQFQELIPKNEKEKKKWEKNRLVAYHGSKRHFFHSLCEGRLKKEGFKIHIAKDLMGRYDRNVKADTLFKVGINTFERILTFPNLLKVTYKNEKNQLKYDRRLKQMESFPVTNSRSRDRAIGELEFECATQESWMKINAGSITFSTNGFILSSWNDISYYGYWSWDRADEWLPKDYQPIRRED